MKLTCSKCFGNKTYRGMGSMIIKCEPCNGSGYIEVQTKIAPIQEEKASKKPGKGHSDEKNSKSNQAG